MVFNTFLTHISYTQIFFYYMQLTEINIPNSFIICNGHLSISIEILLLKSLFRELIYSFKVVVPYCISKKSWKLPWLVWLSGLSAFLGTKGLLVPFPVKAHAWVSGQVPGQGCVRDKYTLMFLSLSFSFPYPFSKKK